MQPLYTAALHSPHHHNPPSSYPLSLPTDPGGDESVQELVCGAGAAAAALRGPSR